MFSETPIRIRRRSAAAAEISPPLSPPQCQQLERHELCQPLLRQFRAEGILPPLLIYDTPLIITAINISMVAIAIEAARAATSQPAGAAIVRRHAARLQRPAKIRRQLVRIPAAEEMREPPASQLRRPPNGIENADSQAGQPPRQPATLLELPVRAAAEGW